MPLTRRGKKRGSTDELEDLITRMINDLDEEQKEDIIRRYTRDSSKGIRLMKRMRRSDMTKEEILRSAILQKIMRGEKASDDETPRTRPGYSPWDERTGEYRNQATAAISREADRKPSAEEYDPNVFHCKDGPVDIPPECREYKFKFKWSELKDLIKKDIQFTFYETRTDDPEYDPDDPEYDPEYDLKFINGAEVKVCHNNGARNCTINLHTLTDILEEDSIGEKMWGKVADTLGARLISKQIRTSSPVHGVFDPSAEGFGLDLLFD